MASALTPLGQRTRAGFIKKYGAKTGPQKHKEAMDKGLLDRSKQENIGLTADADEGAAPSPAGGSEMMDNEPPEAMAEGAAIPPMPIPAPRPNPSKAGKRKVPLGLARAAQGAFQRRPG